MTSRKAIVLTGFVWCAIMGGLILFKQYTLWTGTEVRLRAMSSGVVHGPFRPRISLRYDIASGIPRHLGEHRLYRRGDVIYVCLQEHRGYIQAQSLHATPPTNCLFLRGEIRLAGSDTVQISYSGIEDYYLGADADDVRYGYGRPIDVTVVIDAYGDATIKEIELVSAA